MPKIPEGAKAPQDHQDKAGPKYEEVEVTLNEGTDDERKVPARRVTVDGVTVTVPEEALDDFEVLDASSRLQQQDPSALTALLRLLVGNDWSRIMQELKASASTGRVNVETGAKFVNDLLGALNPNS